MCSIVCPHSTQRVLRTAFLAGLVASPIVAAEMIAPRQSLADVTPAEDIPPGAAQCVVQGPATMVEVPQPNNDRVRNACVYTPPSPQTQAQPHSPEERAQPPAPQPPPSARGGGPGAPDLSPNGPQR